VSASVGRARRNIYPLSIGHEPSRHGLVDTEKHELHAAQFLRIAGVDVNHVIDDASVHPGVEILEITRFANTRAAYCVVTLGWSKTTNVDRLLFFRQVHTFRG